MSKTTYHNYLEQSFNIDESVIDCCTSSNYDEKVNQLLMKTVSQDNSFIKLISRYPEACNKEISRALINFLGDGNYFFGNGSEDLIVKINTLSKLNDWRVAVLKPLFYRIPETLDDYIEFSYDEFWKADLERINLCWMVNPNSINDAYVNKDKLIRIIKENPEVYFVIDETSVFYFDDWKDRTLFNEVKNYQNLIVISSLSKYFGVPGLRFGFGLGPKKIYDQMARVSAFFPINAIGANYIITLLNNSHLFDDYRQKINENKKKVLEVLKKNCFLEVKNTSLNFVLCKNKQGDLYKKFLDNGILVYDMGEADNFYRGWVRLTIHSSTEINQNLVHKLLNFVNSYNE